MSSPITFSGFNNIDFNSVLSALMTQASQPLVALQNRQSALQQQISTFNTLKSKVAAAESAASALADRDALSTLSATSSDTSIAGVSVGSNAVSGHYDIVVSELARAQTTASASTAPDSDTTIVASGGTLTIGGVTVSLTGDTTLEGLAQAINDTDDIGVTASAVKTGTNAYRLVLTSRLTGLDNGFTITNGLTGGSGVAFTDTNHDGTSGDSAADNAVSASNAQLLVNNVAVSSSSNTITDVVTGVSLTVYKKDPATTVKIDVASDSTALTNKVQSFISAYNDLVTFFDGQRTSAAAGTASSIGRDPLLLQIRSRLRAELLDAHGAGTFTRLSELGIEFKVGGSIKLDTARFSEAVASNGDAVRNLLGGTSGAFANVSSLLKGFSTSTGVISSITDRISKQVTNMTTQIQTMQDRLALQRASLAQQFTEADAAMTRLKNQSSSLSSISTSSF